MSDMPNEVREAAREIARASLNTLRNIIADEFPGVEPEIQSEFVAEVCAMMSRKPDDDEAITDKWWSQFTNGELSIATPMTGLLTMNWGRLFLNSSCLIANPTRGQLRMLLRALQPTSEATNE